MVPDIIGSMKDSPDEMNRKRYQMFVDQAGDLAACQNELEAISRVLGLTGAESRPMVLYVQDLKQQLAEVTQERDDAVDKREGAYMRIDQQNAAIHQVAALRQQLEVVQQELASAEMRSVAHLKMYTEASQQQVETLMRGAR